MFAVELITHAVYKNSLKLTPLHQAYSLWPVKVIPIMLAMGQSQEMPKSLTGHASA